MQVVERQGRVSIRHGPDMTGLSACGVVTATGLGPYMGLHRTNSKEQTRGVLQYLHL